MYNTVGRRMQLDRMDGNTVYQEPDQRMAELAAKGAANARPPLPLSPCIKVVSTGEVHEWTQFFADRPDLCVNCDENGNTDPTTWMGRSPAGMRAKMQHVDIYADYKREQAQVKEAMRNQAIQQGQPPIPAPPGLMFFNAEFETGPLPGAVPPVALASALLGIPQGFTQDYTDPVTTRAAMPLAVMQGHGNQTVGDVVATVFQRQAHY